MVLSSILGQSLGVNLVVGEERAFVKAMTQANVSSLADSIGTQNGAIQPVEGAQCHQVVVSP